MTDFLEATFSLPDGKYYPFRKPNNELLYINPPPIIEKLPKMVSKRIADLSCEEDEFAKAKAPYVAALTKSGYSSTFEYSEPTTRQRTRNRKVQSSI